MFDALTFQRAAHLSARAQPRPGGAPGDARRPPPVRHLSGARDRDRRRHASSATAASASSSTPRRGSAATCSSRRAWSSAGAPGCPARRVIGDRVKIGAGAKILGPDQDRRRRARRRQRGGDPRRRRRARWSSGVPARPIERRFKVVDGIPTAPPVGQGRVPELGTALAIDSPREDSMLTADAEGKTGFPSPGKWPDGLVGSI